MINANDKNLNKIKKHLKSCLDKDRRFDNTLGLNLCASGYMHFSVANFINYLILDKEGTPKQISKVIPVTESTDGAIKWDDPMPDLTSLKTNSTNILYPEKKDEIITMPTGRVSSLRELCARYLLTDTLRDYLICLPLVYERLVCSLYHESCEYLLKEVLCFEKKIKKNGIKNILCQKKAHSLEHIFSHLKDKTKKEIKKNSKLCCLLEKYKKAEGQIFNNHKMSWSAYLRFNEDVKNFSTDYLDIVRALSWLLYEEVFNLDLSE